MADALMAEGRRRRRMLDGVAVEARRSGAFTGVRLAVSLAQGMALGLDLPGVVPVSSSPRSPWDRPTTRRAGARADRCTHRGEGYLRRRIPPRRWSAAPLARSTPESVGAARRSGRCPMPMPERDRRSRLGFAYRDRGARCAAGARRRRFGRTKRALSQGAAASALPRRASSRAGRAVPRISTRCRLSRDKVALTPTGTARRACAGAPLRLSAIAAASTGRGTRRSRSSR